MENFIVSARKYRPASFDMVVGQESITNTLRSAVKNKKIAHAYLFCGPRGVGKTTCARIFAKTINCSDPGPNGEPCDKCESCLSFNSLRSFNIHELDAASNNKVEDIRSLNEQVRIPPQIGRYSIYIIDEVHMLTSQAFNAFLKTLEEPPSHAVFILATTEKHKIIPTILSRCQIFDFSRIRLEEIVRRLLFVAAGEGIDAEEEALHVIAQKADGAMRDALSIFDQIVSLSGKSVKYRDVIENLNVLDYEYYFRTVDGALAGDVSEVLMTFNEVLEKGFDGHNFISGLNSHLRDLLVSKDESTLRLLEATPALRQRYHLQSSKCSVDFLFRALETGNSCDLAYKSSKNQRLHVELSLIKLCRLNSQNGSEAEKKKPEPVTETNPEPVTEPKKESKRPAQHEDVKRESPALEKLPVSETFNVSHEPVIDKPSKTFSIRDLISGEGTKKNYPEKNSSVSVNEPDDRNKEEFTPEVFDKAWKDFTETLTSEGTRIVAMFQTIKPEYENESAIRLHLSNATQKDTFNLNYRQKLINFLEQRFILHDVEIETAIDNSESANIIYGDKQKEDYLLNKYPALKEMKRMLNLDIP